MPDNSQYYEAGNDTAIFIMNVSSNFLCGNLHISNRVFTLNFNSSGHFFAEDLDDEYDPVMDAEDDEEVLELSDAKDATTMAIVSAMVYYKPRCSENNL